MNEQHIGQTRDMAFPYVECAIGGADRRNNILRLEDYSPNGYSDCYTTYLRFSESLKTWQKQNDGSVSGYRGTAKADFFPADFDCEEDPGRALSDLRTTARRWEAAYDLPLNALRVYFSGFKGFSVEIPEELFGGLEPGCGISERFKVLAGDLLADSPTADMSIYTPVALWRTPNTKHGKSGLYKIALETTEWLHLSFAEIKELARDKRSARFVDASEFEPVAALKDLWTSSKAWTKEREYAPSVDPENVLGGLRKGERDRKIFEFACSLRGARVPRDAAEELVLKAARNCTPPFPDKAALQKVASAYRYPPGDARKETNGTNFYSSEYKDEVSDETKPVVVFTTGRKIAESVPEDTDWVVAPWFAAGAITEVSGQIKTAGKTTFVAHACRKVLDGAPFMGAPTKRGAVVYLTEQAPTSFRKVIEAAGLDHDDFHVLYWHESRGIPWPELVEAAADHAEQVEAGMLVVDVLSRWCGLEGDGENSSGAALEAMAPLKEAAGRGLTVVYLRHDRKSGGDVGQSGRGSSQFGGDADQLIQLSRPSGNDARPTVRVIESIGRFGDETPDKLNIELHNGEYRALGDAVAYAREAAMRTVCEVLPATPEKAIEAREVVSRAADRGCKRTAVTDAMRRLTDAKTIVRLGAGKRGDPHRYYKPLPGDEPEPSFYSSETPTYSTDETNSEASDVEKPSATLAEEGSVEALLQEPPGWLATQLEKCREKPERFTKPTAAAIAQHLYGTTSRGEEVRPRLEQWAAERSRA